MCTMWCFYIHIYSDMITITKLVNIASLHSYSFLCVHGENSWHYYISEFQVYIFILNSHHAVH